ncbi:hypothetical protein VPH35_104694 [Triticum aestivum]
MDLAAQLDQERVNAHGRARCRIWPETMAWRSRGDSGSAWGRGSRGRNRRTWQHQQVPEGSPRLGRGAPVRLGRSGARGTTHGRTAGHGSMARAGDAMAVAAVLVTGQRMAEHSEEAGNGQRGRFGLVGCEEEVGLR